MLDTMLDPANFIGRSPIQVSRYCGTGGEVEQALLPYKKYIESSKAVELTI